MSVNTTPFLHLPQWDADEQPSYLGEINPAFATIDSGYGNIKTLAQTGVTGSQEAITTANAAKAQSQANAGAITTLQQSLTQLEADFVDASYLKNVALEGTPAETITIVKANLVYNKFCAFIAIAFSCTNWMNFFNQSGNVSMASFTNIPFIFKSVYLYGGFSGPIAMRNNLGHFVDSKTVSLHANGNVLVVNGVGDTITENSNAQFEVSATVPIFKNSANARNQMSDNCLFLKD